MITINKTIHYCWFGKNPKPKSVQDYLHNWEVMLPSFKIVEWNEDNFDINCCAYVKEAYKEKKYAFVSDYARLHALYHHGGIYLDTDVEVLRDLTPLLSDKVVLGFEEFNYIATSTMIAPIASIFIKDFMESYHSRSFYDENGKLDQTTNVAKITEMLVCAGLSRNGLAQALNYKDESIQILDQLKLSPLDYPNNINKADATTFTVHHFGQSWASTNNKIKKQIKTVIIKLIGGNRFKIIRDKYFN